MPRNRSIILLLAAEASALACTLLVFLADKLLHLGPDGTLTAVLLMTTLVTAILLFFALPPLIWFSSRSLLTLKSNRNAVSVGAIAVGVCIWLAVGAWLIVVYQANSK